VFLLLPVAWVARQSFMQGGVLGASQWVGLDNWREAPGDSALREALVNTLLYTAMVVPATIGLGLLLAGAALRPTSSWPPPRDRLSRSTTRHSARPSPR
jgi:ABC-type sugar transport system permease subunit